MVDFKRLEKHIIDNIAEAQLKLGYEGRPISLNYTCSSLAHLLRTDLSQNDIQTILMDFAGYAHPHLGDLTFTPVKNGFCITIPAGGTEFVHSLYSENSFISKLISAVRDRRSLEDILNIFRSFSDSVSITKTDGDEFQYLVYFEDHTPDDYIYCLSVDEEIDGSSHVTYHRFIREDYEEFGF